MGGWELIIALFGGAWYVISAITAANEKKKKKASRKLALQAEDLASKPSSPSQQQQTSASLEKAVEPAKRASEPLPLRESKVDLKLAQSQGTPSVAPKATRPQAGVMRDARKAILESMRKELGLPTQPKSSPPASPASLKVPASTPPKPVFSRSPKPTDPPKPQPRAFSTRTAPEAPKQPSAKALAAILKKPAGLKQAMVLSEIFQPPVSLRGRHLS